MKLKSETVAEEFSDQMNKRSTPSELRSLTATLKECEMAKLVKKRY